MLIKFKSSEWELELTSIGLMQLNDIYSKKYSGGLGCCAAIRLTQKRYHFLVKKILNSFRFILVTPHGSKIF
jgi:hypothetical protein